MKIILELADVQQAITEHINNTLLQNPYRVATIGLIETGQIEVDLRLAPDDQSPGAKGNGVLSNTQPRPLGRPSKRQISDEQMAEIRAGVIADKTARQIAEETGIKRSTVSYHGTKIRKELSGASDAQFPEAKADGVQ